MADSKQVEIVKQYIAKLGQEEAEVQKKLDSAEGFFCRWRMSSQRLDALIEEKKALFQKIEENTARLEQLYAPLPPPPSRFMKAFDDTYEFMTKVAFGFACLGATYSTVVCIWRNWTLLRLRYGGLTESQLHWRKYFLGIGEGYPVGACKVGLWSCMVMVMYLGLIQTQHKKIAIPPHAEGGSCRSEACTP